MVVAPVTAFHSSRVVAGRLGILLLIAIAFDGCAFDRSPQLGAPSLEPGAMQDGIVPPHVSPVVAPTGSKTDGAVSNSLKNDAGSPLPPPTVSGLQCGGIACAFGTPPEKPCCTTSNDVTQGSARAADRCGVGLGSSGSAFFQSACWQRDQGGVASTACPDVDVSVQPGQVESGCCSDQGRCGSINTSDTIGCHYALGKVPRTCGGSDIDPRVQCSPLGVFGVRITVDTAWGGRSGGLFDLTDDGRAPIVIDLMITLSEITGNLEVQGIAKACAVRLPAFYGTTLCETYQPIFPNTLWDSPRLPSFALTGHFQCLNPGCFVTIDALTALLGIDLENPEAPWPSPTETTSLSCAKGIGAACFPDHDGDGFPGLTIEMLTQGIAPPGIGCNGTYNYKGTPLSANPFAIFNGVRRADRLFLGVRAKLGGSAKITSGCNGGVGAGIAQYVQSRSPGCEVQAGTFDFGTPPVGAGQRCNASESGFLDENLPLYDVLAVGQAPASNLKVTDTSVSKGPQMSFVRLGALGDRVTCEEVRTANYPAAL